MIEFIQNETKKIMYKCCDRYAKQHQKETEKVQLVLGLNEEGNTYTLCDEYVPVEELDILGVLGVKIDFLGYSRLAPPFIVKSLVRFSETHNIEIINTKVLCVPTKNEKGKNDMFLFLYNGNQYVETITFSDLFDERDAELPQQQ
jgi:hypothetical protein